MEDEQLMKLCCFVAKKPAILFQPGVTTSKH